MWNTRRHVIFSVGYTAHRSDCATEEMKNAELDSAIFGNGWLNELLGHYEVAAAILLPAGLVALHAERLFLAVAYGADAIGADAERDHVLFNGGSTTIAER